MHLTVVEHVTNCIYIHTRILIYSQFNCYLCYDVKWMQTFTNNAVNYSGTTFNLIKKAFCSACLLLMSFQRIYFLISNHIQFTTFTTCPHVFYLRICIMMLTWVAISRNKQSDKCPCLKLMLHSNVHAIAKPLVIDSYKSRTLGVRKVKLGF